MNDNFAVPHSPPSLPSEKAGDAACDTFQAVADPAEAFALEQYLQTLR